MNTIQKPPSKIGNIVEFSPPVSVGEAPTRRGKIKDEIWSEIYKDSEWGSYVYTSQFIEWDGGGYSVRLTYYYQPEGSARWFFGGQYSVEDSPKIIQKLLEDTLKKTTWFQTGN
jgi:hypothetical protein